MADSPSIHYCLAEVKKAVGAVGKNQRNTVQNFNFRGVDAVVNAAAPALNEQGVITAPRLLDYTYDTVEVGRNKTAMAHVIVKVAYDFIGPSGDSVMAIVLAEAMDSGDKAVPKAMSVAYRIALLQVLNLPTDEPDPDESVYERSPRTAESANKPDMPSRPISANTPESATVPDFVNRAKSAKTVTELRTIYREAGAKGLLKSEFVVNEDSGEKILLETYIQNRNDAMTTKSGSGATARATRSSGAK